MRHLTLITALLVSGCIDDTSPASEGDEADSGEVADVDVCQQGGSAPFCPEGFDPVDDCVGHDPATCERVEYCGATWACVPTPPPCVPPAAACPDGYREVQTCAAPMMCLEMSDCGQTYLCMYDECLQPGLTPPCPDPLRYRATPCEAAEPAACQDTEWCGQTYACVGEPEKPPVVVVECGAGWTHRGPGRCLPGDHARCFEMDVEGATHVCQDARCAEELAIDEGQCPNVLGARGCYPNEVDCGDLPWCGVVFEQCTIDEVDCDAFPDCPAGTYDLRLEQCLEDQGDGLCDTASTCPPGDSACETHVTCASPLACFAEACREYEAACPAGKRFADEAEWRDCEAGGPEADRASGCVFEARCAQSFWCVDEG